MKKFITISHHSTWHKWMIWIGNFCQVFRDPKDCLGFGYYDLYKEDGILEDGVFIKRFCLNHIMICWCDGEKYRKKHNIQYDNWDE